VSWAEYTEAARELAELRRRDEAVHADRNEVARTADSDLERLDKHLAAQQTYLTGLAKRLRLPEPYLGATQRSPVTDLAQALHRAADAANAAETESRRAEDAATKPLLLPNLSPTARNALIYSAFTAVGWVLQCGLIMISDETDFGAIAWSLCGLPALAFFAGYITVSTLGQPRVGGKDYPKNPRLGGVICFAGMTLAWLALIAFFSFLTG
jgi:hypothetical protein